MVLSEKSKKWVPNPELSEVSFEEVRSGCQRGEVDACRVFFNGFEATFEKALEEVRKEVGIDISPNEVKLRIIHDEKQILGAGYFPNRKEIVVNTAYLEDWEEVKDLIKAELVHHYAETRVFNKKQKETQQKEQQETKEELKTPREWKEQEQ